MKPNKLFFIGLIVFVLYGQYYAQTDIKLSMTSIHPSSTTYKKSRDRTQSYRKNLDHNNQKEKDHPPNQPRW